MMQATTPKLGDFEGLVFTTARMFASQVKMEEEDLRQELRVRVWKAVEAYNPARSPTLKGFVYGCVANKIKDYKRNAARRAEYGLSFGYIEDYRTSSHSRPDGSLDHFEMTYACAAPEQVYGRIDEGMLTIPSTLTATEASVLVLLMFDMTEREIRLRLRLTRTEVQSASSSLRAKLADWQPSQQRIVMLEAVLAA